MSGTAQPEPLIHGEGTPETVWAACPTLQAVPAWTLDQWLPATARLVVVAPHPDDEVLGCGGLVAAHSSRGGTVLVLAVTDGEASHPDDPAWPPAQLAQARRAESLAGLASLTATPPAATACWQRHSLGFADGNVAAAVAPLQAPLQAQLQPWLQAGDVVVTTWQHDGHPDHDATGAAVLQACANQGCRVLQAPVWMWHWAQCPDLPPGAPPAVGSAVPWQRLRGFALDDSAWQRKQQALAAHASQLAPRAGPQEPVLGTQIVQRARRRTEFYFI